MPEIGRHEIVIVEEERNEEDEDEYYGQDYDNEY